jgi:hypothetical protein
MVDEIRSNQFVNQIKVPLPPHLFLIATGNSLILFWRRGGINAAPTPSACTSTWSDKGIDTWKNS